VKREKTIPSELWKHILHSMPIACVDLIIHRPVKRDTCVLLGLRKIYPYNDRWALPGGRIIKGESLRQTADRQLHEIGLRPTGDCMLVGVYSTNFRHRSDISICLSTCLPSPQELQRTKKLVRYVWRHLDDLPSRVGSSYKKMLRDFKNHVYHVP
jgi:ADP-ribose pyrophosphatase YjhB (NUDIX family)